MPKLQIPGSISAALVTLKTALTDQMGSGVETTGAPSVDPLVIPLVGWDGPDLKSSDQDAIKGSYMGTFASFAAVMAGQTWIEIPFANGWSQWGDGNYYDAQYKLTGLGTVKLRGLARKPSVIVTSSVIGTLPVGCRPAKASIHPVVCNSQFGEIRVFNNGDILATTGAFPAADAWWSLDGIEFEVI